ncbi:hypothetical protein DSM104299_01938 [Baekduia alba]|uniref:TetR/AcrR family transcriptional regulator n=1 Tax=Baekduia alba TaxID=2997333 RepID=UPI002340F647|nr:TetR/AcrR family transcriptional regulator [Baekduia alba]WCB93231.1 hypothetical protein DSM104299_01938 [Baekduia alba]
MTGERPLRADARRNRDKVLAAATVAFATDGATVPLDDIARRAGVGAGTVYRHFPTKEALFEAVVLARFTALVGFARDQASAERDPTDALFATIGHLVVDSAAKRDLVDALHGAGVDLGPALLAAGEELREALGALLAQARDAGGVRDDVALSDLMGLLSGAIHTASGSGHAAVAPALAAQVLCDGLRPPRS